MHSKVVDRPNARALRALFVANDGFSAGHVARTLAIARALARRAATRVAIEPRMILATTSEAHTLLDSENNALAIVRLPAPLAARRAGFSDLERRRIVHGALEGVADAFAPDLIVADTFPSGPHGELASIWAGRCKRALVRRAVPADVNVKATTGVLTDGLVDYDMVILADDPVAYESSFPTSIKTVRVPPITMGEARDALSRDEARAQLDLPCEGRVVLVAAGGGGDEESVARAKAIATSIVRASPNVTVALALGPLSPPGQVSGAVTPSPAQVDGVVAPSPAQVSAVAPSPAQVSAVAPSPAQVDGVVAPSPTQVSAAPSPAQVGAVAPSPAQASGAVAPAQVGGAVAPSLAQVGSAVAPSLAQVSGAVAPSPAQVGFAGADRIRLVRVAPLQPLLAAFDGAIAPAGYNTAHELAKARVPMALFAQPRPYDDQAGRAARFATSSLAHVLEDFDDTTITKALDWILDDASRRNAAPMIIEAGGADRAADALLDLVMGRLR